MANSLVESMFDAISVGDEVALGRCLERATIATMFQFQALYGVSPLRFCVTFGGREHLGLMRRLLASGLVEATHPDSDDLTVLEYADTTGDDELVAEIITIITRGRHDATACYEMMKHGSLKLFRTFLSLRSQADEPAEFQSIASALVKMTVKNYPLPKDLHIFLLWKLSDFGYRHLVGDWPGPTEPCEWKGQMDVFDDCWCAIRAYDTRMYNDIDSHLLYRLQVIHNQLYFLKNFPFLDHLPLAQVVFCLAVFISIFRDPKDYEKYRLVVNKYQIMDCLRMVRRQLARARDSMDRMRRELTTIVGEVALASDRSDSSTELWEQVQALGIPESDNWMKGKRKDFDRLEAGTGEERATIMNKLIKDIQTKKKQLMKSANRTENNGTQETSAKDDAASKLQTEIYKRLPHLSTPKNVANKLLADLKKNKPVDATIDEVLATEVIDLSFLVHGKDRRSVRRMSKCYERTKQLYSLYKSMSYITLIITHDLNYDSMAVDSLKRFMQVLGEAFKNTQNSPNLPGKVQNIIVHLLSTGFLNMVKKLRETFSHSLTLARVLTDERLEWRVFLQMVGHFKMTHTLLHLVCAVAIEEARLAFYGQMYRCRSIEQLRSLFEYVGTGEMLRKDQGDSFRIVKDFFANADDLLNKLRKLPVATTAEFSVVAAQIKIRYDLIKEFGEILDSEAELGYVQLRRASFARGELHTVHRLLDFILTMRSPFNFYGHLKPAWEDIDIELTRILPLDSRLMMLLERPVPYIPDVFVKNLRSLEMDDYMSETREVLLKVESTNDEERAKRLNELLKPYYDNIFALDLKRKILETFFEIKRKNKKPDDDGKAAAIEQIIKRDQVFLQTLFDERRSRLRKMLEQYGVVSVDSLKKFSIPAHTAGAMEYLQLELTEMLTAVGYFGNSFHYVKQCIPMIQGKNYRNYLAHDSISYNFLSDTHREKIVINALVIANTEVQLFGRRSNPIGENMRFPTPDDRHRWANEQQQLMTAIRTRDAGKIQAAMQAGGEFQGHFCCSSNPRPDGTYYRPATELCNPFDAGPEITDRQHRDDETVLTESPTLTTIQYDIIKHVPLEILRTSIAKYKPNEEDFVDMLTIAIRAKNGPAFSHLLTQDWWRRQIPAMLAMCYHVAATIDGQHGTLKLLLEKYPPPNRNDLLEIMHRSAWTARWKHVRLLQDFGVSVDASYRMLGNINSTALLRLVEHGQSRLLARLKSLDRKAYGTAVPHPLAIAVHYGTDTVRMVRELKRLGFDWLDNTTVLHEKIMTYDSESLQQTWAELDAERLKHSSVHAETERVSTTLNVLQHWKVIAYTEQVAAGQTSLLAALKMRMEPPLSTHNTRKAETIRTLKKRLKLLSCPEDDETKKVEIATLRASIRRLEMCDEERRYEVASTLLARYRSTRRIKGFGVLGNILFQHGANIVRIDKQLKDITINVQNCCSEMITRLKNLASLSGSWREVTIDAGLPVTFYVYSLFNDGPIPSRHAIARKLTLADGGSLQDRLTELQNLSDAWFSDCVGICAEVVIGGVKLCYWQVENVRCVFDVRPEGSEVDVVGYINMQDRTGANALLWCINISHARKEQERKFQHRLAKLLLENGANPLQPDDNGYVSVIWALSESTHPAIAHDAIDECLRRDLRSSRGATVLNIVEEPTQTTMIHAAVQGARLDVVQRLLELDVKLDVSNVNGESPAHLAANIPMQKSPQLLKLLLDKDPSLAHKKDGEGRTVLNCAVERNSTKLVDLILTYDPVETAVMSALETACEEGYVEMTERLLSYATRRESLR